MCRVLRKLEKKGLIESEWGVTDTGRDAKFYCLSELGEADLSIGVTTWHRYVDAMGRVLGAPGT